MFAKNICADNTQNENQDMAYSGGSYFFDVICCNKWDDILFFAPYENIKTREKLRKKNYPFFNDRKYLMNQNNDL